MVKVKTSITFDLFGLPRVHVTDSSSFLSIPSTTITFTLMARAHKTFTKNNKDNKMKGKVLI